MVMPSGSISSTPVIRSSNSAMPPSSGRAPQSPVSPPCGVTGTPAWWQRRRAAATSSALSGRITASGAVGGRKLQSVRLRSGRSSPTRTSAGPSVCQRASSRSVVVSPFADIPFPSRRDFGSRRPHSAPQARPCGSPFAGFIALRRRRLPPVECMNLDPVADADLTQRVRGERIGEVRRDPVHAGDPHRRSALDLGAVGH